MARSGTLEVAHTEIPLLTVTMNASKRSSKYENAFQIAQKYGIRLELPEDSNVGGWNETKRCWRQRHLHDPELEDICII